MNTITLAELKRGGMHALDATLKHGPTFLMKRNRPAAVVLTHEYYQRLQSAQVVPPALPPNALAMFLAAPAAPSGGLSGEALQRRVEEAKGEWADR